MKRIIVLRSLALAALAGVLVSCSAKTKTTAVAKPVVIYAATSGMPRPFTYVNESGELVGHNVELIKAVFARLPQYELRLEVTDFPSIFAGLDSGRYQLGVNNFGMNESRKEKYIFSDPIFRTYDVVVFGPKAKIPDLDKLSSFRGLAGLTTINAPGNHASTVLENYNKDNPDAAVVLNYSDGDVLLQVREVEEGKYDFMLLDKPLYDQYTAEYKLALRKLELTDDFISTFSKGYSYLLIIKGQDQLAQEINAALAEVIKDGTSKQINLKYFGTDYTPYR